MIDSFIWRISIKVKILIIVFLTFLGSLFSQNLQDSTKKSDKKIKAFMFGIYGGIGFYEMNNIQKAQSEVIRSSPFDMQIVNDFPPYFNFGLQFSRLNKGGYYYGVFYRNEFTAGRIGTRDYSGEIQSDVILNSQDAGLSFYFNPINTNSVGFMLGFDVGIKFTEEKIYEQLNVYGIEPSIIKENNDYNNFFFSPGMKVFYDYQRLLFTFDLNLHIGLTSDENPINTIYAEEWSGLRLGVTANYMLSVFN